jgi:hypothetical protein
VDIFALGFCINDLPVGINDSATHSATHATGDGTMRKTGLLLVLLGTVLSATGCAPLLIGGAGVVVADEVIEQDQGGDGLF